VRRGVLGGWKFGNGDIIVRVILLLLSLKLEAFGMIQGAGTPIDQRSPPWPWESGGRVPQTVRGERVSAARARPRATRPTRGGRERRCRWLRWCRWFQTWKILKEVLEGAEV